MSLSGEIQAGVPFPREWEGLSCAWPDPGLSGGEADGALSSLMSHVP